MRTIIFILLVIAMCWFAADCAASTPADANPAPSGDPASTPAGANPAPSGDPASTPAGANPVPSGDPAADLQAPENAVAGQPLTLHVNGSGTLYLIGPGQVIKREVKSGSVEIKGEELRSAGRWIAVAGDQSQVFWVKPGKPENLSFLARPSRVPVARPDVISGVTFVFDKYQNLVLDPTPVNFKLSVGDTGSAKTVNSRSATAAATRCRMARLSRSSRLTKTGRARWIPASRRALPAPSCPLPRAPPLPWLPGWCWATNCT
jgi:hypothetical protein